MLYVFDTNVFSQIFGSYYPLSFPTLRQNLEESVLEGRITSTREVLHELENCRHKELLHWAKKRNYVFPTPTADEAEIVREIFSIHHFQASIERKKLYSGMPNADCFLIARAKALDATIVTLEKYSGSGVKIPDICEHFGVNCISLEKFMTLENWIYQEASVGKSAVSPTAELNENASTRQPKSYRAPSPAVLILLILPLFGIFTALMTLALDSRKPDPPAPTFVPAPPRSVVNFAAPDFELPLLDGVSLVSPGDYAGRPLFLNFWATWCAPCVRELPALEEFVAQHSADPDGPALLTINLGEPAAVISSFLDEIGITNLPVAMDINQVVKRDYGVQNLPTTFIIDGEGQIRYMKLGEMTTEDMEAYLDALEQDSS